MIKNLFWIVFYVLNVYFFMNHQGPPGPPGPPGARGLDGKDCEFSSYKDQPLHAHSLKSDSNLVVLNHTRTNSLTVNHNAVFSKITVASCIGCVSPSACYDHSHCHTSYASLTASVLNSKSIQSSSTDSDTTIQARQLTFKSSKKVLISSETSSVDVYTRNLVFTSDTLLSGNFALEKLMVRPKLVSKEDSLPQYVDSCAILKLLKIRYNMGFEYIDASDPELYKHFLSTRADRIDIAEVLGLSVNCIQELMRFVEY